jgi:hypothetical protein
MSTSTLISVAGERCPACGSPLATDQRYCIDCGERRGEPRLPLMGGPTPPPAPRAREPRGASAAALIAGVATLLVALAVGVLIGRSGQRPVAANSPSYRVVTVPAAGGTTAAAATATPSAVATTTVAKALKKAKKAATPPPQKAATPPPTVKVGQKGHGRGYKNGKFTGDFFGP